MLAERPRAGAERIPDTLQALIAARIDRLPATQRTLIQRAAAMGRLFMRGALEHLSPDVDDVEAALEELVARDLDRPRGARDDQRRARVQVQARADPRGRVRRPLEELARRPPPRVRDPGSASGQATSCSRSGRSTSTRRPVCSRSSTAPHRRSSRSRRRMRSRAPAGARCRARRSAARGSCSCVRSSSRRRLERRYFAARAAWRLADMTAVIVEMDEVAKAAAAAGETQLQGRALTALADALLYQRADALGAQRLITEALEVLEGEPPEIRFEPLSIASQIAGWLGDNDAFERWAKLALGAAQVAGRKDQEAIVTQRARDRVPAPARVRRGGAARRARGRARRRERQRLQPRQRARRARLARGAPLQLRRGGSGVRRCARALRRDRQRAPRGLDDAEPRPHGSRAGRPRARREAAPRLGARA